MGLSLIREPVETLRYFFLFCAATARHYIPIVISSIYFKILFLPALLVYLVSLTRYDGGMLYRWRFAVEYFVWWFGTGVLSSVGLGTGMHTGVMFLFPHIFRVVLAANKCGSTDFFAANDIWLRDDPELFQCSGSGSGSGSDDVSGGALNVSYLSVLAKVFLPCFLWGAGTAAGEIPPYAVSRAAALAGRVDEEWEEMTHAQSKWNLLNRMRDWMIEFLQRHGFIGVLLMAAWPNMAFDLCGMCCGHFLMPFWQFFGATFIGKALIKVNMQAAFFVAIFTPRHLKQIITLIDQLFPPAYEPCQYFWGRECHILAEDALKDVTQKIGDGHQSSEAVASAESWMKRAWGLVIVAFLLWFVTSAISQFATQYKSELTSDDAARAVLPKGSPGARLQTPTRPKGAPGRKSPTRRLSAAKKQR